MISLGVDESKRTLNEWANLERLQRQTAFGHTIQKWWCLSGSCKSNSSPNLGAIWNCLDIQIYDFLFNSFSPPNLNWSNNRIAFLEGGPQELDKNTSEHVCGTINTFGCAPSSRPAGRRRSDFTWNIEPCSTVDAARTIVRIRTSVGSHRRSAFWPGKWARTDWKIERSSEARSAAWRRFGSESDQADQASADSMNSCISIWSITSYSKRRTFRREVSALTLQLNKVDSKGFRKHNYEPSHFV